MFNMSRKRASILPPTLPKSGLNPVTKIVAYPVKVVIDSFIREGGQAFQQVSTKDLLAQQRQLIQQMDAVPAQAALGRRQRPVWMGLQTFEAAALPGYSQSSRSPTGALTPNGGGSGGGSGGGVIPSLPVYTPVLPDTIITETDTEEDTSISRVAPPKPAPSITTSIADQIISGGGLYVTPDAGGSIIAPGPGGTQPIEAPTITTGPTTYTYKDIQGYVLFNIENKSMNPMPLSALVSARIGDTELVRTNFQTRLMPLKTKQFKSDFILQGDQSALVKAIKGDLTGNTPFPEAVTITLDAVVQWHLFRNSVSATLAVPLGTEATF